MVAAAQHSSVHSKTARITAQPSLPQQDSSHQRWSQPCRPAWLRTSRIQMRRRCCLSRPRSQPAAGAVYVSERSGDKIGLSTVGSGLAGAPGTCTGRTSAGTRDCQRRPCCCPAVSAWQDVCKTACLEQKVLSLTVTSVSATEWSPSALAEPTPMAVEVLPGCGGVGWVGERAVVGQRSGGEALDEWLYERCGCITCKHYASQGPAELLSKRQVATAGTHRRPGIAGMRNLCSPTGCDLAGAAPWNSGSVAHPSCSSRVDIGASKRAFARGTGIAYGHRQGVPVPRGLQGASREGRLAEECIRS